MKSRFRIISTLVVLALLASLFMVAPVSGATGTVAVDKTHVTTPTTGGALTVTLTDSDLEAGQVQTDEATDALTGSDYTTSNTGGGSFVVRTQKRPILDANGDGIVNDEDVTLSTTTMRVLDVGQNSGNITIINDTAPNNTAFTITYTAADYQSHTVTVASTQDSTGFSLVLRETGAATGVFTASVDVAGTTTSTDDILQGTLNGLTLAVDFDGNGTTTNDTTRSVNGVAGLTTSTENALVNALGTAVGLDLNGDGYLTSTLASDISEVAIGLDLNGDGVLSTGLSTSTVFNLANAVNESIARIDVDGDGYTTGTSDILGVDLNGDGYTTGTLVFAIDLRQLPESVTRPMIGAASGDQITFTYDDAGTSRVGSVTVETTAPAVKVLSPIDNDATQAIATTDIDLEVTDADAGVDELTIDIIVTSTTSGVDTALQGTATAITAGFTAKHRVTGVVAGETTLTYVVTATDKAGNVGYSDSDADTAGTQAHTLKFDTVAPAYATLAAETGHFWDSAATTPALETDATKADSTSIAVYFNEDIDGSTVSRTDFTVAGTAPVAANHYSADADMVFLTVAALASDSTPAVAVVGSISDKAGNTVSSIGGATAVDGIGPTITVAISPDTNLSQTTVTITVSSDERFLTAPEIKSNGATSELSAVASAGTNVFSTTLTGSATNAYNIEVTSRDTANNVVTTGATTHDGTDAVVVELDSALPAPVTSPIDSVDTTAYSGSPLFVEINYADEAKEYGLDVAAGALSTTTGNIVVDLDTHAAVAITAITLDGTDISSSLNSEGTARYIVALGELDVSATAYVLAFTGQDDAGNTADTTLTFTVAVRPDFSIPLTTGWNLISLPGSPAAGSTGINTVIPSTHDIDLVMTYDPTDARKWLTATRGADGLFDTSEISDIGSSLAYFVRTTSFDALEVTIPGTRGGDASSLPEISLVEGWNLVPVRDVKGDKVAGDSIAASTYLDTVSEKRVYGYDPLNDRFETASNVAVGKGYWVWLSAAGTLVP